MHGTQDCHQVDTFTWVIIDLPLYCMHNNMQLCISNCNLLYTHIARNSIALYMQEYNSVTTQLYSDSHVCMYMALCGALSMDGIPVPGHISTRFFAPKIFTSTGELFL